MFSIKTKNNLIILLIFAIFIFPFIAAQLYFNYGSPKTATTNKGILLNNPRNISEIQLQDLSEQISNNKIFVDKLDSKKWYVLFNKPSDCNKTCEKTIFNTQQAVLSLGKNSNRVQRVIINNNINNYKNNWENILINHPHITMAKSNLSHLELDDIINHQNIYIADPHGNIILKYDYNKSSFGNDLFKDLKKLLAISNIG